MHRQSLKAIVPTAVLRNTCGTKFFLLAATVPAMIGLTSVGEGWTIKAGAGWTRDSSGAADLFCSNCSSSRLE